MPRGDETVEFSFSAVLPLKRKAWIDAGDLITELRLLVEQTGAHVKLDQRSLNQGQGRSGLFGLLGGSNAPPSNIFFELDGVRMRVAQYGEPCADKRAIHRYVNPSLWTEGLGEFADHQAYIRIYESGIEGEDGPDAVFDRAAAVTATASVIARLANPVGVIWLPARNSVPMRMFGAAIEELTEGSAPVQFWVRWLPTPYHGKEELQPGFVTNGLGAFAGREILVRPSKIPTLTMVDHAYDLAHKLIDERLAIKDQQMLEIDKATGLRVRLRPPGAETESPTYEIAVEPMSGKSAEPEQARKAANNDMRHAADPARIEGIKVADTDNDTTGRIRVIPGGKS